MYHKIFTEPKVSKLSILKYIFRRFMFWSMLRIVGSFQNDKKFIFIIGCGHSGTTLLAREIGKCNDVLLVPRETNWFVKCINYSGLRSNLRDIETIATSLNKNFIVEKTPKHIHQIDILQAALDETILVSIIRNPFDTIGSLYKRTGDFDFALERYCTDNAVLLNMMKERDNRLNLIRFEDFTADPTGVIQRLIGEFGIGDYDVESSVSYPASYSNSDLFQLRISQLEKPIAQNTGHSAEILNQQQRDAIRSQCEDIINEFYEDLNDIF